MGTKKTTYAAETALPDKVGLTTAPGDLMLLLYARHVSTIFNLPDYGTDDTHKAGEADPVRVHLVALGAFHAERVEVRVLLGISRLEARDTV